MQQCSNSKDLQDPPKDGNDLFFSRLQLMIVMAKAYLEGNPIGEYRKEAILENANGLFYMALHGEHAKSVSDPQDPEEVAERKRFYEKVRLLSVMGKAFAENRLSGSQKRKELQENIDYISNVVTFNSTIKDIDFLRVA